MHQRGGGPVPTKHCSWTDRDPLRLVVAKKTRYGKMTYAAAELEYAREIMPSSTYLKPESPMSQQFSQRCVGIAARRATAVTAVRIVAGTNAPVCSRVL